LEALSVVLDHVPELKELIFPVLDVPRLSRAEAIAKVCVNLNGRQSRVMAFGVSAASKNPSTHTGPMYEHLTFSISSKGVYLRSTILCLQTRVACEPLKGAVKVRWSSVKKGERPKGQSVIKESNI
jgi:hypothetical protein